MSDAPSSQLDDYLDVFTNPTGLFERRSDGKFGQALLILTLAVVVMFFVTRSAMAPIWDAEIGRSMAAAMKANPQMTAEQAEAGKKFAGTIGMVFFIAGFPVGLLLLGLGVMLGAKVVGKSLSYAQGATIATFAMFPRLVETVVAAVQALLMDESTLNGRLKVTLGIGRFLDPDKTAPLMLGLLGRIDLFTLWVTALVFIGVRTMTKASNGQALAAAVFVWFWGAIPVLLGALRS